MNTVTITDTMLEVEPQGLDKMWSFTRRLRIPLEHVRGATFDPGAADDRKGLRGPGLGVPGKWSGTWTLEGEKHFWNVSSAQDTIVVELEAEHYTRLFLTVEQPGEVVDAINAALSAGPPRD